MTRITLFSIVLIIYLIYAGFKYRGTWKRLSYWQLIGLLVTFIGIISLSGIVLFFGTRFITDAISNMIITFIVQFLSVIVVIIAAALIFMTVSSKITNGIVPIYKDNNKEATKH